MTPSLGSNPTHGLSTDAAFGGSARISPILKWAGGKTQLLPHLLPMANTQFDRYLEPFFGGGALFFALQPNRALIADSNPELINLYRQVASDVEQVIAALREYKNDKSLFYEVRELEFEKLDPIEAAARTIFLNRTCFNGLYRLNKHGRFNVPFGNYRNPKICNAQGLRLASELLSNAEIVLADFRETLTKYPTPGDLIYLDPPYLPISKYADFKRYTANQFHDNDHRDLADHVHRLRSKGCKIIASNANHALVYNLYGDLPIRAIPAKRNISRSGRSRTGIDVIVDGTNTAEESPKHSALPIPRQAMCFPPTRFMGSKERILDAIWEVVRDLEFESALDLFSGTGVVSYLFKSAGKRTIANDYMAMCANTSEALIENRNVTLDTDDIELLLSETGDGDGFVQSTFANLYFDEIDNALIDRVRVNLTKLDGKYKQAIAMAALIRSCLKKRARGVFSYVGQRYDDGRKDLTLSLEEHLRTSIKLINSAVFDNGHRNLANWGDAMSVRANADLVYIDPPYYSPLSDNEYVRRYHFVEGLARNWEGVSLQSHTKTKKFKSYPTPWSSP